MGLANKIERRFRGIDSPGKLKLATAGCPRNCSEAMVKDIGAVAIGDGKWEIYVGGAADLMCAKATCSAPSMARTRCCSITGRFMQWYRENAKYKERTYTFVERMGIERARAGRGRRQRRHRRRARCGDAMRPVAAMKDPWIEATRPRRKISLHPH